MGWSLLLPRDADARAVLAELRGWDRTVSQPEPGVVIFGDGYRLRGPLPVGPLNHPVAWLSRRWAVWCSPCAGCSPPGTFRPTG